MAALTREIFEMAEQRSFGQSYPVYVNNLKEIGVQSYRVAVSNHDRRIFSGIHQPTLEIPGSTPAPFARHEKCRDKCHSPQV